MKVEQLTTVADVAALAPAWNRLSRGVPFRSWEWLGAWWEHYGGRATGSRSPARLFVLAVRHDDEIVGLAPWYLQPHPLYGCVVRFLGDGEVCSDYLSVLCKPGWEAKLATTLAEWLLDKSPHDLDGGWSLLEFDQIDAEDLMMRRLIDELAARGALEYCQPGASCWRVSLPEAWDEYVASLCKQHRRKIRNWQRNIFDSCRGQWHTATTPEELEVGWPILVDLHQRRRRSLGEPGCFASPRFTAFHEAVTRKLLAAGKLRLQWLTLDDRPVAAGYFLSGNGVVYAYQSGVEVDALAEEPGHLTFMAAIRSAIGAGFRSFDLLRGDEPYKALWRARPRPAMNFRILQGRVADRLVYSLWSAGDSVKAWLRGRLNKPATAISQPTADATLQLTTR